MTLNSEPPIPASSATVLVRIDLEPPRQSRLSVFFRGVLCIPLVIVLFILTIGVDVIVVLAWFAALATGRVPHSFHRFLTRYERFSANLLAYQYLLVPKWPGIEYPRPDEQVSVEILNVTQSRLSIFFRALLSIPAGFLGACWNFGHALITFVMWVWVLIRGRAPRALHQYGALWLRYNVRLSSYTLLLTPEQPWHSVRGDGVATPGTFAATSPSEAHIDVSTMSADGIEPETSADDGFRWNVTQGARNLVNWSIPLGGVLFVAYLGIIIAFSAGRFSATEQVTSSYNATYNVEQSFATTVTTCPTVTCINQASLVAESGEVRAIADLRVNFGGTIQFQAYGDDLDTLVSDYDFMSRETTISSIKTTFTAWQSETEKTRTDVNALLASLT